MYRSGNSAKLFLCACNGKYFEELFILILNKIVVSGCYVSPTPAVRLVAAHLNKYDVKKRGKPKTVTFPEVEHRLDNSAASFECSRINKSIMYVTMHKRKAPIIMLSGSKTPQKTKKLAVTDVREKSVDFLMELKGRLLLLLQ